MGSWFETAGNVIDAIKINRMELCRYDGDLYWVKHRRCWSRLLIAGANRFFRFAGNPVVVRSRPGEWRYSEVAVFDLLNGSEGYDVFVDEEGDVWAERLPGVPLDHHAFSGTLTPGMLEAAGRELGRAHRLFFDGIGARWSHGDPHLGNLIYDEHEGRVRLIDFEATHAPGMDEAQRHADDLLVVLQDLLGHADDCDWLACARKFLEAYQEAVPHAAARFALLSGRLQQPKGTARLWWGIRTGYLSTAVLYERLDQLADLIASLGVENAAGMEATVRLNGAVPEESFAVQELL